MPKDPIVVKPQGVAGTIVEELQRIAAHRQLGQLIPCIGVVVGSGAVGSLGTQTIGIVGVGPGGSSITQGL